MPFGHVPRFCHPCRTVAPDSIGDRFDCRHHLLLVLLLSAHPIQGPLCSKNTLERCVRPSQNTWSQPPTCPAKTGFSPHEVHSKSTFFGWILPTLRTSEFTVLQIVGLDAAVVSCLIIMHDRKTDLNTPLQLLNFFKSSFYLFATCTLLAAVALVPINYRENGTTEGVPPPAKDPEESMFLLGKKETYHGSTLYLTSRRVPVLIA